MYLTSNTATVRTYGSYAETTVFKTQCERYTKPEEQEGSVTKGERMDTADGRTTIRNKLNAPDGFGTWISGIVESRNT